MQDTEFFERALGLKKPWRVKEVKMDVGAKKVELEVECMEKTLWASESGERLQIHDWERRSWRHLDTMQFETRINALVPRVKYPDGHTETVKVPWAEVRSRWTELFECVAIEVLLAARSVSQACELLRIDWSSAQRIMDRAVARGLCRRSHEGITRVGLDEKSFGRGQDYISVLSDLEASRVLEVTPGNDTESGQRLWQSIPPEQRAKVEAAAMDMSAGFAAATRIEAPGAEIVYDKYHVSAKLNEAVNAVRKQEPRHLSEQGDERLKGSRQLWLYDPVNLDDARQESFAELAAENLKTSRAWMHKENFREFWAQQSRWEGEGYFKQWYGGAIRSRLLPIKKVAKSLKEHLDGLLAYFGHRITNAATEALNGRIAALKANARGFRSFEHYRTRILFFLGKLDLRPTPQL
jgi:transposase